MLRIHANPLECSLTIKSRRELLKRGNISSVSNMFLKESMHLTLVKPFDHSNHISNIIRHTHRKTKYIHKSELFLLEIKSDKDDQAAQ